MLVEVIGQVEVRPGMEEGTQLPHMVVSQLIRVSGEEECPQAELSVFNTRWQLIEAGKEVTTTKRSPYLQFNEQGTFYGHTGCNNLHGSYELDGSDLSLSGVAVTKMACPNQDNQEGAFLQALNQVSGLTQQDRQLLLTDKDGTILLQFKATPTQ
jgi:heat shock protein HslJ